MAGIREDIDSKVAIVEAPMIMMAVSRGPEFRPFSATPIIPSCEVVSMNPPVAKKPCLRCSPRSRRAVP